MGGPARHRNDEFLGREDVGEGADLDVHEAGFLTRLHPFGFLQVWRAFRSAGPQDAVRFAPLIYFARHPALDTIRACISMGFDDVIALPFGEGVSDRILRQIGRLHVYYETETYFGPDRRDRTAATREATPDAGQFRRYEIMRSPEKGIDVLHNDFQVVV